MEADRATQYLELAREIHAEVERTAGDPATDLDDLARALDEWPADLRAAAVVDAFRGLPAEQRWQILAALFDDDELRAALVAERDRSAADAARARRHGALLAAVRDDGALDTRDVPAGAELTVGLFRAVDVRGVLPLGPASAVCARRLVLRATGDDGGFVVVDDVFNPSHGLFVTPDYDEAVWRDERLEPNSRVRIGAADGSFETLVRPGGRLDIESAGAVRRGRLHAGYATVDAVSLFTGAPS